MAINPAAMTLLYDSLNIKFQLITLLDFFTYKCKIHNSIHPWNGRFIPDIPHERKGST